MNLNYLYTVVWFPDLGNRNITVQCSPARYNPKTKSFTNSSAFFASEHGNMFLEQIFPVIIDDYFMTLVKELKEVVEFEMMQYAEQTSLELDIYRDGKYYSLKTDIPYPAVYGNYIVDRETGIAYLEDPRAIAVINNSILDLYRNYTSNLNSIIAAQSKFHRFTR